MHHILFTYFIVDEQHAIKIFYITHNYSQIIFSFHEFLLCSPLAQGAGQQCCYGSDGTLMKGQVGGSVDKESPLRSYYTHILTDLLPYILCCKGTPVCDRYFDSRPAGSEMGYRLPVPGTGNSLTFTQVCRLIFLSSISSLFWRKHG